MHTRNSLYYHIAYLRLLQHYNCLQVVRKCIPLLLMERRQKQAKTLFAEADEG